MEKEIEAKFFIKDKESMRLKLSNLHLQLFKEEFLMKRKTFDNNVIGEWIRVRDEGYKITMTYKHIIEKNLNGVNEIEIEVSDFEKTVAFIKAISEYKEISYQENFREIWKNEEVEIVIDSWPYLPFYIEIEAKSEEIVKKYSKLLDFNFEKESFFGGVDTLYNNYFNIPISEFLKIKKITFNNIELKKILKI